MGPQLAGVSLTSIQEPVRAELDQVFHELGRIIRVDFPRIAQVNQHLLRIKGKMFRPTLALLSAQASGATGPQTVTLGAVVELIHLATLIHDDSVDHSVLRRGQPTVNAMFSHQVAVIMGDYLYSRAVQQLVDLDDLEPLRVMSRVTNEMTIGEMREIEAHDVLDFSLEEYDRLIDAKTASLMSGACEVGALGGDPAYREPLRRYGRCLGMAFQIVDDLLDYTSTQEVTGKPAGLDLREHKITLPLIAALPSMDEQERGLVSALMADPTPADEQIAEVVGIAHTRGGITAAQERAQEFAVLAEAELDQLPETRARDALRDCITYVVERRS
ncbi:MAG: polyprenyl synthetase family protein [Gemmatimonadota bacterium]|nr:MAG: polyprenyl synthetase family protein [Gemmatimonadota bacterium]